MYQGARYKPLPAIAQVKPSKLLQYMPVVNAISQKSQKKTSYLKSQRMFGGRYKQRQCSAVTLLLQLVTDKDRGVRAAALGVMEVAYRQEGPAALWKLVGRLSDQQHSLIEERLKYTDKQASAQASCHFPIIRKSLLGKCRVCPGGIAQRLWVCGQIVWLSVFRSYCGHFELP